jgi:hypothetical protein
MPGAAKTERPTWTASQREATEHEATYRRFPVRLSRTEHARISFMLYSLGSKQFGAYVISALPPNAGPNGP